MLKRREAAEETLQESFISIWRHAAEYDSGKGAPFTWMASIVRHRALDVLRRGKREVLTDDDSKIQNATERGEVSPDDLDFSSESRALKNCLAELQPDQGRCITVAYYEGLTNEELARKMKKPLGTIKTWIRRGLERIRNVWRNPVNIAFPSLRGGDEGEDDLG
jgi:RNA polymerase sigma-70 factor (ECF subfamily)